MKKKILLLAMFVGIYIFMCFFVWHGKNPITYYWNRQKGVYNTQKEFNYYREGETNWLIPLNGRLFYRDYETDEMRELVLTNETSTDKISSGTGAYENSKYIYIETNDKVIQYTEEGKQVSVKEFENEDIRSMYVGENCVYVLTVNTFNDESFEYKLWILDAEKVEKSVDIGDVKEEKAFGAFIKEEGTIVEHKAFETSEIILYYCGKIERKDSEKDIVYQIKGEYTSDGYEFEPVMVNKLKGNRIYITGIELETENLLATYGDRIYAWDDGSEYTPEYLKLYCTELDGDTDVIYESEIYKPILARVSGSTLIILGEDFYKMPLEEGGAPYLTGDYRGAVLLYYDMDKQKIIRECEFEDEQIVCMDADAYATLKDGAI